MYSVVSAILLGFVSAFPGATLAQDFVRDYRSSDNFGAGASGDLSDRSIAIAELADGRSIATWVQTNDCLVRAQLFDRYLQPVGAEQVIGSDQLESEPNYNLGLSCRRAPVIAALSDGGFVAAYNVFYDDPDIIQPDTDGGIFRSSTPRAGLSKIHIVEFSGEITAAGQLAEVHRSTVNDNRLLRNPGIAASGNEFVLTYNFCDCQPTARFESGQIPMLWNVAVVHYGADWTGVELAEEMRQPSEEFYPARIPDGCTIDRRDVFRRYDEDSSYDAEYDPANVILNIFTGGGWAWFGILYEAIEEEPLRTPPGETIYWDIWDIECATRPGPVYSAGPPSIAFSDDVYALTWAELDFAGDGVELTGLRAFFELGSTGRTRIPRPLFNTLSIDTDADGNVRERGYTRLPCFNYQTINYMPQASQRPNFRLSYRADNYDGETFGNVPEQIQGTTWDQQGNLYFITTHLEVVSSNAEVVTKNSCIHGRNFNAVSGPGFDLTNQPAGVRFLAPRVEVVQEAGLVDGSNPQFRIVAEAREGSRQASIYTFDTSCSDRRACLIDQFDLPVLVPSDVPISTQWADPRIIDLRRHEHTILYNDYGQRARQYQLTGAGHVNWNLASEGNVSRSLFDGVDGRFGVLGVTFEFGSGYQLTTHSVRRRLTHGGDSLSRGPGSVGPGTLTSLYGGGFAAVEFDSSSFESSQRFSLFHATSPEETPGVIDVVQTGIIGFGNNPTTSLAAFPGGGFISVWTSALPSTELDGPAHSVRAQRYDANGERSGPEILVDEIPSGNFTGQVSRVATLSDGGFIIAATSPLPTSTTRLLWEARYDSSGNLLRRRNLRSDVASSDFALLRLASGQIILGWKNEARWLVWDISHDQPAFLRSYETGSIAGVNSFIPFSDQKGFLVVSSSTTAPDGSFLINAHGEDGRHYRSVEINLNSYSGAHDNWLFDGLNNFRITPADQGHFYAFWLQRESGQEGLRLYSQLLSPRLSPTGPPRANALDFWVGNEIVDPLDYVPGNISRADLSVVRMVDGRYAVSFELPGGGYSGSRTIFLRAPVIQPYFSGLPYYQNGNFVANLTSDGIALGDVSVLVNAAVENATLTNIVAGSESVEFSLTPLEEGLSTFDIGLRSTIPDLIVADPDPLHVIVDFTAPTAQLTSDASGVIGGPFDIHMQFDEPVFGFNFDLFGAGRLAVQNGAMSNFEATSLSAYRATITPEASGPVRVNISSDVAVDRAGNGNVAAQPFTITYDNEPPSVTGISGPDGLVNGSFTVTATFSESVSGFSLSGFVVTNGVASNLQAINSSTYSATITPISDGQTSVTISAGAAQDSVGNPNRASIYFLIVTVDQISPTLTLSTTTTSPTSGPFTVTATTSEDVTGFDVTDLVIGNGAASNFQAVSATVYTATVTPAADGVVTIDVAAGAASDAAGNPSTAATQLAVTSDSTQPGVTLSTTATSPASGPFTVTATTSEDVTGLDVTDLVIGNGSAANFQAVSATVYTATVTPAADGVVTIDVAAGAASDAADNPSTAAAQLSVTFDGTAPDVTLSTTASSPASGPFTVTVTTSEDVTGLDVTDLVIGNGSAANFQAVSATVYTATITPAADGVVTIDVADGAASDAAGNLSTAAAQLSVTFDGTAPDVTLSTTASSPASGPFTVTATTSEDVTGLDVTDLVIGNGSAANFQAVSATIYTATVTPAADGVVTIDVAAGAARDAAGNPSTAAAQLSVTSDSTRPGVTLTGPAGLVNGENGADIVFTFSENIIGFDPSQLVISGGDWVSGNSGDGLSFTVKVFPTADGVMTVDYPANSVNDAAGNSNTAAGQYSVTTDISRPTVAITGVPSTTTGAFTATFTFSEAVTGFEPSSIQLGVGLSASNFQAVSTSIYSALITPTVDTNSGLSVAACAARDVAGNCNDASANVLVAADITPPTLVSIQRASPTSSLTNADQLGWRMAFSEPVSGIDAADFTVTGTTASVASVNVVAAALPEIAGAGTGIVPFAVAANIYDISVSGGDLPGLNGVVTIGFAPGQNITDSLGNALAQTVPTGTNQPSFTVDNLPPTVTISSDATDPVSLPFAFTILFSEPVSGFDESDVVVTNAALSFGSFGGDGTSFTGVLTPSADGPVTIDVAAAVADDAAGNQNVAATQFSIVSDIDTVRTLTVTRTGPGTGVVTSEPAGINCGGDCTASYAVGSDVNLIAVADPGSSFASWTGDDCVDPLSTICIVRMTINQAIEARFILDAPAPSHIIAAVLPGARSGYVDGLPVSAFLTVMNPTAIPAQSCLITIPSDAPLAQSYFQLDTNGDPVGPENPLFDIIPGGALNFVIAMTATAQTGPDGYSFMPVITCQNASLDPIVGVNDILLNIGAAPTPDILSIAATPSGDGVIRIPAAGGIQFMSASALNIGAGDGLGAAGEVTLTATIDTGAASLPLNLEICQINASAICISPRGPSVTSTMAQNTPTFFAAFVRDTSTGGIPFDPANARVFMRFADATGTIRSATSAAVTAPAPAVAPEIASSLPTGRWNVLMRQPDDGQTPSLVRTTLFVMGDGRVMIDDGIEPRLTTVASIAADNDDGTQARFSALGHDGVWTSAGSIRLGSPWAEQVGEFWGVRDARSEAMLDWLDFPGRYGATPNGAGIEISAGGSIRGTVAGCIVSGQADQGMAANLTLTSCSQAGIYSAILDTPANDHGAPALLIANGSHGWRLER